MSLPSPGAVDSLGANKTIVIDTIAPIVSQYLVVYGTNNLTFDLATLPMGRDILPWQVTGVRVVFSEAIATGNQASLTGIPASGLSGLTTSILTWTFGALADGSYNTSVLGTGVNAIKDAAGNPLGDGSDFNRSFRVLYGDANGDGVVNSLDMAVVATNTTTPNSLFLFADVTGNGVVDLNDYREVRKRIGRSLP